MSEITTVGLDLAKTVFQLHGADASGRTLLRRKLRRGQVLEALAGLPRCTVAMEACGGAHYWGREIGKLGHEVRLIPPAYVKPFVRRQKNDAADAEAICEAAQRPNMRVTPKACLRHDAGEERGEAERSGRLPGARASGPAAHADDQRAPRSPDRVRRCCATGGVERASPGRTRRGGGRRVAGGGAGDVAGSGRWSAPPRRADRGARC